MKHSPPEPPKEGEMSNWEGEVGELKLVLLVRNLTLNSDAVPNNNYMFGLCRGPLLHL